MQAIKRKFGDVVITAETDGTQWRLSSSSGEKSLWTSHQEGILTLRVGNRRFAYATTYWAGMLPIEEPFQISLGEHLI